MKTDYFGIIGVDISNENFIFIDETNKELTIKLQPDFEKSTKISWIEKWILLRVFKRLTPASQDKE